MKRELFVDTYVIVNALMNWACLYTASKLTGIFAKRFRLVLAALIGSAYAVVTLAAELPRTASVFLWLPASALMCLTAFGRMRPARFFSSVLVTTVCAFACGGIAQGIVNLTGSLDNGGKIGLSVLLIAVIGLVSAFRFSGELAKKRLSSVRATVRIDAFGKTKRMIGLCDSGNLLTEPISGWPVLIIGASEARGFVPGDYLGFTSPPSENFFAVPLSTLGGSKLIYGFVPQSLVISGAGKRRPHSVNEVIVAVDAQTELFCGCGCLVPARLI